MPITYHADAAQGVLFSDWRGTITITEVSAYWTAFTSDKEAMACRGAIADLRECELQFNGASIRDLTERILKPAFQGKKWRSAIVVKDPVQFGMSRQYGVYSEIFLSGNVNVFYSDVMALKWLLEDDPGAGI